MAVTFRTAQTEQRDSGIFFTRENAAVLLDELRHDHAELLERLKGQ